MAPRAARGNGHAGSLQEGYTVSPATLAARERLTAAAEKNHTTIA